MYLKKIITEFKKYHYFIYINNKIGRISSDNSNTKAKQDALMKLLKLDKDNVYIYRVKLSKSSTLSSALINIKNTGSLYIQIREYIFKKNKKIYPNNENIDVNVFIKNKYLKEGIKMKDINSNILKYIKGNLSLIPSKLNYIK